MLRQKFAHILLSTALVGALAPLEAVAQFRRPTELVAKPGVSLVDPNGAYAVDLNPAALSGLDTWSLRYVHAQGPKDSRVTDGGDAAYFATPLLWGLAFGIGGERVRPRQAAGLANRGILSLALAYAPTETLGAGLAVRYTGSRDPSVDDLTSVDLALRWTPTSTFGLALLGYDMLGPLDLVGANIPVEMTGVFAASYRPFGDDRLGLEAASGIDTAGRFSMRASTQIGLPYVGRATVSGEFRDLDTDSPELRLIAGLDVIWGHIMAGGGVVYGDQTGDSPGFYFHGGLDGKVREGLPTPDYLSDIEVRNELSARRLLSLVYRLDQARYDRQAAGVLLRLRDTDMGTAYAQEVRLMLNELKRAKKTTTCHLDAASGGEFYACSAAKHRWLDPAGGVRLAGPSIHVILLGDLLRKVGIRADFVRIGKFKSAPEQYSRATSSKPASFQREVLLDDIYTRIVSDMGRDLGKSPKAVAEIIDRGPFVTPEAMQYGLATKAADEADLDNELRRALGASIGRKSSGSDISSSKWHDQPRIGVVVIDDTIVDGENVDIPILDIHMTGGKTIVDKVEQMAADPTVKAIVLRIDSPGGSALASDQIWRAVRRARKRKPVIASMGAVAASGGYYVASAAQEIWANPSTVTGSIGVFYGKVDVEQLAQKVGINVEHIERGKRAGAETLWRPFTEDERSMLKEKVAFWYNLFLQRVSKGRGMPVKQVHKLAQGRVWSGDSALQNKLIDNLGGFGAALVRARELAGLQPDCAVDVVPTRPETLLDYVLGASNKPMRLGQSKGSTRKLSAAEDRVLRTKTLAFKGNSLLKKTRWREALKTALTLGHIREGVGMAWMPSTLSIE